MNTALVQFERLSVSKLHLKLKSNALLFEIIQIQLFVRTQLSEL